MKKNVFSFLLILSMVYSLGFLFFLDDSLHLEKQVELFLNMEVGLLVSIQVSMIFSFFAIQFPILVDFPMFLLFHFCILFVGKMFRTDKFTIGYSIFILCDSLVYFFAKAAEGRSGRRQQE